MSWLKRTYSTELPDRLFSAQKPEPVNNPEMALYNQSLADVLGIDGNLSVEEALNYLSGNEIVPESHPISQAYAGHQFGYFTKLGDGRAVLLGEIETNHGLFDLQLKGSGQTPYSRRGDGRATFYSMLREYLISEAMHALHIPTTRSLAVVKSSDKVFREQISEGAVLSRVAASHIRVGTFEYARFFGEARDLEKILQYTIQRHYPELLDHENHALALLEKVMQKQKDLIVDWLRVGFIHGVMNTDNMALSGETIDYGPCAFMNVYHPKTVFSSIDTQGRYAFGNQPNMAYWNLSVFANALLPLIDQDEALAKEKAEALLDRFTEDFSGANFDMMANKLGITHPIQEDGEIMQGCLQLMMKHRVDYTNFFTDLRRGGESIDQLSNDEVFKDWHTKWEAARFRNATLAESEALMTNTNPVVIPRNHIVEEVLAAAVAGDMQPFHSLLHELASPYIEAAITQMVPTDFDASYQTFCGT